MALDLVTGYKGAAHITAEDVGAFNAGIIGEGDYVLNSGNKLSASLTSNNTVKILDGDLVMQGRHITLKKGTFEEVTIENGESGQNRIDLIVARYTKDSNTGVENVVFAVIKGASTSGTATDPEYTTGDILSGSCTLHEMPLYRISLSGLTAGTPEAMFKLSEFPLCEMSGLLYRGTLKDDWVTAEKNTPEYWRNIGNGVFYAPDGKYVGGHFNGLSNSGSLINLVSDSNVSQLFFTNGFLSFRGSYQNDWASDWANVHNGISYVMGTYTGDETPFRLINLGFKPAAVLVTRNDGAMSVPVWGTTAGAYIYGGFAVTGSNCVYWNGFAEYGVVTIEREGFQVYYSTLGDGTDSEKGHIMTNSSSKFHYIAFKRQR